MSDRIFRPSAAALSFISSGTFANIFVLHANFVSKDKNYKLFVLIYVEAAVRRCSVKKVFLEISQNSQENTCARVSFLIKLQAWPATLLKKRLWHRCFPVNFAKFLRTPFFTEHLWWLLLNMISTISSSITSHQFNFFSELSFLVTAVPISKKSNEIYYLILIFDNLIP